MVREDLNYYWETGSTYMKFLSFLCHITCSYSFFDREEDRSTPLTEHDVNTPPFALFDPVLLLPLLNPCMG